MEGSTIIIIVFTIVFSALFSGLEIAFISSNKLRIELENKQGRLSSGIISRFFLTNPSKFIGTMLVGNNIALVIYGIFMARLLEPVFSRMFPGEFTVLVAQTAVSTLVILFTAEYLPKAIFRTHPNTLFSLFAIPAIMLFFLLYPVVLLTIGLSEFLLQKIFRLSLPEGKLDFSRIDLDNFLKEATEGPQNKSEEAIDHEIQIFQNALDFSNLKARDCMIPRTEIIAMDVTDSILNLREKFVETGLSKILIYRQNIDHIIGYVHSYELFKSPADIPSVLRPVMIVPETMSAHDILSQFIQDRKSLAVVVDEFGGTSGLLTMEDVIEQIFGDIEDEHDVEDFIEEKTGPGEYLFSGRLEVDYLNEEYDLDLPEGDYDTLAGLIIANHESIPSPEEEIRINGFIFRIEEVSEKRIEKVRLRIVNGS